MAICISSVDRIERHLNDLLKSISNGSAKDAEQAVKYLASNRAKVHFRLSTAEDDDNGKTSKKTTGSGASASVHVLEFVLIISMDESFIDEFRLKVQIECHLNREPLLETIYVRSGTKLDELKEQVRRFSDLIPQKR